MPTPRPELKIQTKDDSAHNHIPVRSFMKKKQHLKKADKAASIKTEYKSSTTTGVLSAKK